MELRLSKEIYPKIAVLKAAYSFTDRCYILINQDSSDYIISIEAKPDIDPVQEQEFKNELLMQALRLQINDQTKEIRQLITMRAMATTMVGEQPELKQQPLNVGEDDILKDWFAHD